MGVWEIRFQATTENWKNGRKMSKSYGRQFGKEHDGSVALYTNYGTLVKADDIVPEYPATLSRELCFMSPLDNLFRYNNRRKSFFYQ